jgi:NitT/TauT family transport system substrate-binding protein
MSRLPGIAALALAVGLHAAPTHAADLVRVGTPEGTSLPFNLLAIGTKSGSFARNGIEVERQDLAGSAKLHAAVAGGALDIAMGSGSDFLFIIKGVPEIAVGVFQKLPNDLVILTRPGGLAKLADLKGTKMGVAGPGGLTLWVGMSAVRNEGLPPSAVTYAYLGTMPSIIAALVSNNVESVVADTGAAYRVETEGKGRVLALGGDVVHPFIAHLVFATTDLAEHKPELLRRYLKALYETVAFEQTHQAETIAMTADHTGYTQAVAEKVYAAETPQFTTDGHFDPTAMAATKQSLIDLGAVAAADMLPDKSLYTEAFLPQ